MKKIFLVSILFQMMTAIALFPLSNDSSDPGDSGSPYHGWEILETEHFRFIFEPENEPEALEIITFAEEIYDQVTGFLEHKPDKIDVFLNGRYETANGLFSPVAPHIELYITSPTNYFHGSKTEHWLKYLLTHELTHYVHLTSDEGFLNVLAAIFGSSMELPYTVFSHQWMSEGITTNLETLFTNGGRGRNPLFEIYYKAPIVEGTMFSFDQSHYTTMLPPYGRRTYVAGYVLVDHLLNTYGRDIFIKIHKRFLQWPFFGYSDAIKKETGKAPEQIFEDLRHTLIQNFREDLAIPAGELISPQEDGDFSLPRLTQKGWLIYSRHPEKLSSLGWYDPKTEEYDKIIETSLSDDTSFTSDRSGNRIVFSSYRRTGNHPAGTLIQSDLTIMDGDESPRRLTENKRLWHPALSADGQELIAVQGAGSYSRLVQVDIETGKVDILFEQPQTTVFHPQFSPDKSRIAFVVNQRGYQDIWIYDRDSESAEPIIGVDRHGDYYPHFGNNRTIYFSSDRSGSLRLYKYEIDTKTLETAAEDPVGVISGYPQNNKIIYQTYTSHGFAVKSRSFQAFDPLDGAFTEMGTNHQAPPEFAFAEEREAPKKGYVDLPQLILWMPVPINANLSGLSTRLDGLPGGGGYFLGFSPLAQTIYQAMVTMPFIGLQPNGFFDVDFDFHFMKAGYRIEQSYGINNEDLYQQQSRQRLSLSFPVLEESERYQSRYFGINVGADYSYSLVSPEEFPFFNAPSDLFTEDHRLMISGGFSTMFKKGGTAWDYYTRAAFGASANVDTVFLLNSGSMVPEILGDLNLTSKIPLGPRNHSLGLDLSVLGSSTAEADFSGKLRGHPFAEQEQKGLTYYDLSWDFTIIRFDAAVYRALYVSGFAASLFTSADFNWDYDPATFDVNHFYAGAEVVILGGYSSLELALHLGASLRFDPYSDDPFVPRIIPIISLGTSDLL